MRTGFLYRERETALQRVLLAPLLLAEGPYRAAAWLDRGLYEWGLRRRVRLPAATVGVGNLLAGGAAKTPLVRHLAGALRQRGHKPAVLSRGVRGARGREVNVVSDGERMLASVGEAGDEPVWLARSLSGVPVLAGRNRVALGLRACAVFGSSVLLLDDAFQHHRVLRDLDLVCMDERLALGNGHVLPRGPLREPARALRRAHALVWTRAELGSPAPARPAALPEGTPCLRIALRLDSLREAATGERQPPAWLAGREVGLFAGVARPARVVRDLEAQGARVARMREFPDHHRYTRDDLDSLATDLPWVTTEKDAVKLPAGWLSGRVIWVLEETVQEPPGQDLCAFVLQRLASVPALRD